MTWKKKRIIPNDEVKDQISRQRPYRDWVQQNRIPLSSIPLKHPVPVAFSPERLHEMQLAFGYNREDIETTIIPMVTEHKEPVGSMGTDTPLAVFSDLPQRLFNYFKQSFAQVTNPPIDPLREKMVMTLTSYIGTEGNLLSESAEHCHMIQFKRPIFSNSDVEKIRDWDNPNYKTATLQMTFPVSDGPAGLETALERLCQEAEAKVDEGYSFIVLSDRGVDENNAPIPSLLACSGVHH
ncbi:MAG TPA: glutamate synthase central domain-containing protein, partial [Phototrophicaceae bacterium]|nr:glutamate synthase central domain-containing protein [Phototrophicaceae bacterium]